MENGANSLGERHNFSLVYRQLASCRWVQCRASHADDGVPKAASFHCWCRRRRRGDSLHSLRAEVAHKHNPTEQYWYR